MTTSISSEAQKTMDENRLNETTNQNSLKVHKDVKPTNKKTYFKTLKPSEINSPMSPPSLSVDKKISLMSFKASTTNIRTKQCTRYTQAIGISAVS